MGLDHIPDQRQNQFGFWGGGRTDYSAVCSGVLLCQRPNSCVSLFSFTSRIISASSRSHSSSLWA